MTPLFCSRNESTQSQQTTKVQIVPSEVQCLKELVPITQSRTLSLPKSTKLPTPGDRRSETRSTFFRVLAHGAKELDVILP